MTIFGHEGGAGCSDRIWRNTPRPFETDITVTAHILICVIHAGMDVKEHNRHRALLRVKSVFPSSCSVVTVYLCAPVMQVDHNLQNEHHDVMKKLQTRDRDHELIRKLFTEAIK